MKAVRFADDQAMVIAATQKGLQEIMTVLHDTFQEYGMRINMKKTKVMHISRKAGRKLTILIEGHKLDQVEQFVYLGSLVTEDGRCTKGSSKNCFRQNCFQQKERIVERVIEFRIEENNG